MSWVITIIVFFLRPFVVDKIEVSQTMPRRCPWRWKNNWTLQPSWSVNCRRRMRNCKHSSPRWAVRTLKNLFPFCCVDSVYICFYICIICLHLFSPLPSNCLSYSFLCCISTFQWQEIEKERREWEEKLAAADRKVSDSQKALEDMKANAESNARVHLVRSKTGVEEETLTVEELEAKVRELEDLKNNSDGKLEELLRLVSCWVWKWWDVGDVWFKPVVVWFEFTFQQEHCFGFGFLSFFTWLCHETRPFYSGAQELNIEISKLQARIQELGGPEEAPQESLEVQS